MNKKSEHVRGTQELQLTVEEGFLTGTVEGGGVGSGTVTPVTPPPGEPASVEQRSPKNY